MLQVGEEEKNYVPPKAPQRAVGSDASAPKELLKDLKVVLPPSAYACFRKEDNIPAGGWHKVRSAAHE
jgi:hypothetical protein